MRRKIVVKVARISRLLAFCGAFLLAAFHFHPNFFFPSSTFPRPPVFAQGYDRLAGATQ
jgi:hypothetical protein